MVANVAGFNTDYDGAVLIITKLSNWYMTMVRQFMHHGAINGQFLGVSAADSGNSDQPRAIIGQWSIAAGSFGTDGDNAEPCGHV